MDLCNGIFIVGLFAFSNHAFTDDDVYCFGAATFSAYKYCLFTNVYFCGSVVFPFKCYHSAYKAYADVEHLAQFQGGYLLGSVEAMQDDDYNYGL